MYRYRGTTQGIRTIVDKLKNNDRKIKAIREAGFGSFLMITENFVRPEIKEYILEHYDVQTKTLRFSNGRELEITSKDVNRVYLLPNEGKKIKVEEDHKELLMILDMELDLKMNQKGGTSLEFVKKRLEVTEDPEKFAKLFVLLVIATLFRPTSAYLIDVRPYSEVLRDLRSIRYYNWCEHVLELIQKDLQRPNNTFQCDLFFFQTHMLDCLLGPDENPMVVSPSCTLWTKKRCKSKLEWLNNNGGIHNARLLNELHTVQNALNAEEILEQQYKRKEELEILIKSSTAQLDEINQMIAQSLPPMEQNGSEIKEGDESGEGDGIEQVFGEVKDLPMEDEEEREEIGWTENEVEKKEDETVEIKKVSKKKRRKKVIESIDDDFEDSPLKHKSPVQKRQVKPSRMLESPYNDLKTLQVSKFDIDVAEFVFNGKADMNTLMFDDEDNQLNKKDLLKLKGNDWLDDKIINCYASSLSWKELQTSTNGNNPKRFCFSTYVLSKAEGNKQRKKNFLEAYLEKHTRWGRYQTQLTDCEMIFFPCVKNSHWRCFVINMREGKLQYLDTLKHNRFKEVEKIAKFIVSIVDEYIVSFTNTSFKNKKWNIETVPIQDDGDSCGPLICKLMEKWNGHSLPAWIVEWPKQNNIKLLRAQICAQVVVSDVNKQAEELLSQRWKNEGKRQKRTTRSVAQSMVAK